MNEVIQFLKAALTPVTAVTVLLAGVLLILPAEAASFTNTGAITTPRIIHTATLLPNGKVLVAGGYNGGFLLSAELYDPATGTWTVTGPLITARYYHTATLLPNGKVLVAGGQNASGYLSSAEMYDPATGIWTATGPLNFARFEHTATLLPNGKVLIAGGYDGGDVSRAEMYDPATGTWTATGTLNTARRVHTATLLPVGKVMVAGGQDTGSSSLSSAELYDPTTGTWTTTSTLSTARSSPTATLLPVGKVMVAGGLEINNNYLSSTELYDPATGTWTTTGPLNIARYFHTATLLPNGKVLVAGGLGGSGFLSSAELYNPATGTWTATGPLSTARYGHTATLLLNGNVLVAGGYNHNSGYLFSAELYDSGQTIPFPPQKIFLAFNQPSSFSLIVPTAFGRAWPILNPFGSFPAAAISDSYRNSVTSQIKSVYSRSGVHNIEWTTSDSDDAIAVYFCPSVNPELLGYAKPPVDRFNSKRRGEVIIFVNKTLPNLDAESAAHEIGHALGLRHVDPPIATDPSNAEVMDLDFSTSPQFINAVSGVTDITSFSTHNPLYHLLRYVDGWSPAQLQNAGINPGSWDNGSTINTRFSFQNENLRLYNITVFASGGSAESSFALAQIPSATLAELSERSFAVSEGLGIVLLASSTTNGLPDVISSTGDAFSATNQIISPSGTNAFSLFRQDSPTNAVPLSTATAAFDAQSPYCNISMSAPSVLRLDFRGTLQLSTNLTDWADFATNAIPPQFIVLGPNDRVGFFRSKQ